MLKVNLSEVKEVTWNYCERTPWIEKCRQTFANFMAGHKGKSTTNFLCLMWQSVKHIPYIHKHILLDKSNASNLIHSLV